MPPKRRLSATSGGDDGDEDSKEQVQEPGRKKKKMDPGQQMQVVKFPLYHNIKSTKKIIFRQFLILYESTKRKTELSYADPW